MDTPGNDATIHRSYPIEPGDFITAGEAAEEIKKILKQLGIDAALIRKIAVASYEVEMNLVIHTVGGVLSLTVTPREIAIISQDKGPGIKDVELAMKAGYSTASDTAREMGFGAGMGLPNMKRCSDRFDISSEVGKGTKVEMIFNLT